MIPGATRLIICQLLPLVGMAILKSSPHFLHLKTYCGSLPKKTPTFRFRCTSIPFSFSATLTVLICLCPACVGRMLCPWTLTYKKKKQIFCEVSRFPEIQQPNFLPHLSILDYSKGKKSNNLAQEALKSRETLRITKIDWFRDM